MDSLNITNRTKSMNYIRRLNRANFIIQVTVLKFGDLLAGWKLVTNAKFQHNISEIMPARPKNIQRHGV